MLVILQVVIIFPPSQASVWCRIFVFVANHSFRLPLACGKSALFSPQATVTFPAKWLFLSRLRAVYAHLEIRLPCSLRLRLASGILLPLYFRFVYSFSGNLCLDFVSFLFSLFFCFVCFMLYRRTCYSFVSVFHSVVYSLSGNLGLRLCSSSYSFVVFIHSFVYSLFHCFVHWNLYLFVSFILSFVFCLSCCFTQNSFFIFYHFFYSCIHFLLYSIILSLIISVFLFFSSNFFLQLFLLIVLFFVLAANYNLF